MDKNVRRAAVLAVVLLVVLAGGASAKTFELRLVSQTPTKITLGWDPQTNVAAYVFYANGKRVSHSFNGSLTAVTFAKVPGCVQDCYGVEDLSSDGQSLYPAAVTPPPPEGKFYVSPNGSDSNPCSQTQPCATFQRGYLVAAPGDIVCVGDGSYPSQRISYVAGKTTPNVVIQGCNSSPSVLSLNFGDGSGNMPNAVTFKDMAITGSATAKAVTYYYTGKSLASSATDVTFDNVDIAVGKASPGQAVEIIGGTLRLTIRNSRIGPICCGRDVNGGSPVGIRLGTADRASLGYPVSTDTVIDHNVIKGVTRLCSEWLSGYGPCPSTSCPNTQDLCHEDGIQVYGSTNLTFTRNTIYHVGINGLFLDSTDPNNGGTVSNNMIGDIMRGATCFDIDGRGITGTWNISNNTCPAQIGDGYYISWASSMQSNRAVWNWRGNAGAIFISSSFTPSGNCFAGTSGVFTYDWNTFSTNNGGAVGCPNNTNVGEPGYVNLALAPADTMDLHLAGAPGAADDLFPGACFVAADIDGQPRPIIACDSGADER